MAGTRYCQVVVTASRKLKDQGAKVWVIIHKTIFCMQRLVHIKHTGPVPIFTETLRQQSYSGPVNPFLIA